MTAKKEAPADTVELVAYTMFKDDAGDIVYAGDRFTVDRQRGVELEAAHHAGPALASYEDGGTYVELTEEEPPQQVG